MRVHLTDLSIQKLKTDKPQTIYWDASTPGFGIVVGKHTKTFLVTQGKERKRTMLGRYPGTSLQEARRQAKRILNSDVSVQPEPNLSLTEAVQTYLETVQLSPRWLKEQERLLTKHFLSLHGTKDIRAITTTLVLQVTDKLKDTPSEQVHAHKAMQTFFRWALRRSLIDHDPTARLQLPAKLSTRDRVLTPDELKKVWIASEQLGTFGIIVRLCILTGMRRTESSVSWKYYSNDSVLTLPSTVTKNRREHSIPLPKTAASLIKQLPTTSSLIGWSKPKTKIDKLSGVSNWTLHDLRRTAATMMAEHTPPHVIERILNHTTGTMSPLSRVYNRHTYLQEMREALERHESRILSLVDVCTSSTV